MPEKEPSASHRARHIKDARGRRVTQLDPVEMYLLRRHDVIEADVLRAIAQEKGVRIAGTQRAALLVGIAGALLVVSLFTYGAITGDIGDAPYAKSAGLLYLCSLPWITWLGIKKRRFEKVAKAMLKHLRCPHCGYDLRLLPADPADGATVCPECGCAWQLLGETAPQMTPKGGQS